MGERVVGVQGGDQVLHRVSVSVSCQTSGLSFTRRPPRAALSAQRYALITARPPQRAASQNSNYMRPAERTVRVRVYARNILNMPTPGGHADSPCAARLKSVKCTRWGGVVVVVGDVWGSPAGLDED